MLLLCLAVVHTTIYQLSEVDVNENRIPEIINCQSYINLKSFILSDKMTEITKCINEWNATIEALGQGKQTILIRKYNTTLKEFLLYPTISYANKDDVLDSFQDKEFVKDNLLPKGENRTYEVKYFAKVNEVLEKSSSRIGAFNKFHIWTRDHVKNYLGKSQAKIWILRVYKLDKPQYLKRSNGMLYANVDCPVKLEGTPVISDEEFNKLKEKIINTK